MKKTFRVGLSSYAFTWACGISGYPLPPQPLTASNLVEKAAKLGVDVVQIADNIPLSRLSENDLKSLRALSDEKNVGLEVGTRGTMPEHLIQQINIAEFLGSSILRTLITDNDHNLGDKGSLEIETRSLEKAECQIREVLPRLEAAGIILAIENYEQYTCRSLQRLVEKLGSDYVGICLDPVNSFGIAEDQRRITETLATRAVNLHIKDFRITRLPHRMGFLLEGTPAGEGILDIASLLEALPAKEAPISAIIELWTPYLGDIEETIRIEMEWAERSVAHLKLLLQKYA